MQIKINLIIGMAAILFLYDYAFAFNNNTITI
jgi:hypothetical protein